MNDAQEIINRILSGDLSQRAQGFMLVLPRGYRLEGLIEASLERAYGTRGHPDIRRLAPEGAGDMIKVDAVRDAQAFLASTASADGMKTLVLYRAEHLNTNAANALLKPLEEPTRSTRILLVTDNPAPLPSTIRSRCSVYTVMESPALAHQELEGFLASGDVETKEQPEALLALADGDPSLAAEIARHDLSTWIRKLEAWLASKDMTPPLPALAGKSAAPLLAVTMALQALLARIARGDATLTGWTAERASEAAWIAIDRSTDISRAGIDAKTRLHTMLLQLRAISAA